MITEIFLEGKRLDISADISSLLTFAIDDVKDFASRSTTFSKTVILPGTGNNNALFGNIFDTGSSNNYNSLLDNVGYNFNASKSARCLIFQDNLQTFKGSLRLLQINKDKNNIDYEVALNGELTNLNVALSSRYLTDLDFSAYDHVYNETNIVDSWNNEETGIYYPLIDCGGYSTLKHDWLIGTFRPALFVKEYLDKMFAAANYRYTCDLFDTTRFKKLIIPHNQKRLTRLGSNLLTATRSTNYTVAHGEPGESSDVNYVFESVSTSVFSNSGDEEFTFTETASQTVTITIRISGIYHSADSTFVVSLLRNAEVLDSEVFLQVLPDTAYDITLTATILLNFNDVLRVEVVNGGSGTTEHNMNSDFGSFIITTPSAVPIPVIYGDTVIMNQTIPQNIKQVDCLVSIVKLFNLYVFESQFDERHILIAPFVDFYSTDSGNAVDWTYKLNREAPIRIKPMSELNSKTYRFNYKDDTDFYNDLYKKRYNQGYGSYIYDSEFEFTTNENKLELVFASTPLVGYASEDKVYSTIFKKSGTTEEPIDSVIRILQTKKVTGVTSWDILNGVTVLDSLTEYGYAGHFDDPDNPSNDLNFGVLKELFFTLVTGDLTVTQFNVYWSAYMAEITDKDSKLLEGKFYLNPIDIFNLDFSKYVYLDGVLFRLNKITDYNVTTPSDCDVQLLKVINTIY